VIQTVSLNADISSCNHHIIKTCFFRWTFCWFFSLILYFYIFFPYSHRCSLISRTLPLSKLHSWSLVARFGAVIDVASSEDTLNAPLTASPQIPIQFSSKHTKIVRYKTELLDYPSLNLHHLLLDWLEFFICALHRCLLHYRDQQASCQSTSNPLTWIWPLFLLRCSLPFFWHLFLCCKFDLWLNVVFLCLLIVVCFEGFWLI